MSSSKNKIQWLSTEEEEGGPVSFSSSLSPSLCLCLSGATTLCSDCVGRGLHRKKELRQMAQQEWEESRQAYLRCSRESESGNAIQQQWSETAWELQQFKQKLEWLRKETAERASRIARRSLELEERQTAVQQRQEQIAHHRLMLQQLSKTILQESLVRSISSSQTTARRLRVQWALTALSEFYRLQVDANNNNDLLQKQKPHNHPSPVTNIAPRQAKGIGKIGGLPLPNAGLELFGVLPPAELQSALRLVATLIQKVAECLGIPLPHPILLNPDYDAGGSTTDIAFVSTTVPASSSAVASSQQGNNCDAISGGSGGGVTGLASSTSSLVASWMGSAAIAAASTSTAKTQRFTDASITKINMTSTPTSTTNPPSSSSPQSAPLEAAQVQRRIQHAHAAIIAEDDSPNASQYALLADQVEAFGIAWQLLQNDLVALCIRAGVPVQDLWPAEAVLLNLNALYNHLHTVL